MTEIQKQKNARKRTDEKIQDSNIFDLRNCNNNVYEFIESINETVVKNSWRNINNEHEIVFSDDNDFAK